MNDIVKAALLGIVEGVTEFLPVSSTGHLIIVNQWLSFDPAFTAAFDVAIQFGAVLSVLALYRKKLFAFGPGTGEGSARSTFSLWIKVTVGVLPALVLGFLFDDFMEEHLFNATVVAIALVVGGIALLLLDRRPASGRFASVDVLPLRIALAIGAIQCLAMIPGTSRSAATIVGAVLLGASRVAAVEFSFLLALPTIAAASGYSLLKLDKSVLAANVPALAVGALVSFVVAALVASGFLRFIGKRNFAVFGWYRIALGLIILGLLAASFTFAA
ncbi:MAG: undecaprenyl-diphosphatase [Treponema sp. GWB1_62_6]|nr:MAG: undecaprenyl-diphosphatase [Treponema sp. GWA1_62_8]OHE63325.1 MAG: undecaprenyl-diphosphatase [Treponema sp. GWC1_61_84]OHE69194.1 MAG: undecaprenyl-diphosphatase [Treponema sp. RIFOXYC1_FULL_61_9]OHE72352.1 MAG: undecaprenyl-diphosphatase [Treponema sp. GWB1_62_6]HCM26297.1 undecaprenyl-diphosphatase [Treponema sp.]